MPAPSIPGDSEPVVYNANTQLKIRVEDLEAAVPDFLDLPEGLDDIVINRRDNDHVHLESTPTDDSIGKYTPTAILKGKIHERRVIVENGDPTYETVHQRKENATWSSFTPDDLDDIETTPVEYVKFAGWDDDFLVHDILRYEMFSVLCQLTETAFDGFAQAVLAADGELHPVRFEAEGGEVSVSLVLETEESEAEQSAPTFPQ